MGGPAYELLREIMFANPRQNTKYVISNTPNNVHFLKSFESVCCPFEFLLYFTLHPGTTIENRTENFNSDLCDIISEYHTRGKLVDIGTESLDPVDFYIKKQNKYGLMIGAQYCGKTTIANSLKKDSGLTVIQYDSYHEELCKKLSTDDNPVESLPLPDVYKHLNKQMNEAPETQTFLLDGFKPDDGEFERLTEALGTPLFFLRLKTNLETITSRFKLKNELTELSDEDNETLNKINANAEAVNALVDEVVNSNSYTSVYDIDVCVGQWTTLEKVTLEKVREIFMKRVLLVRNLSSSIDSELLQQRCGYLSAKYGYQFINVNSMLADLSKTQMNDGPVDPHTIMNYIKTKVDSCKTINRNVVLFDVLQADKKEGQNYPNSRDEIFLLNHSIGALRACYDFVDVSQDIDVQEVWEEKEQKEEVVKPVPKDGDDDADDPPPADDDDENKKKFDPTQFEWYKIEGNPKSFAVIYNQMNTTEKMKMKYSNIDMTKLEETFKDVHNNLEEGLDVYYYCEAFG